MKQGRQNKRLLSLIVSFVLLIAVLCGLTACGKTLESIEITTAPTKTKYMAGEKFDPTGMVVTANYDKGDPMEVTGYTYDLTEALTEADTKVVISYAGKTAEVEIKVSNPVTGVAIKTHATKTAYKSGETFDPAGMVLTITYYDNSTNDVAIADLEASYSKEALKVGQTEIEVKVNGVSVKEAITVTRGSIIETSVDNEFASTKANKKVFTYYSKGTVLNNTGALSADKEAPEGAIGKFDNRDGGSLSYVFKLKEAGTVDLVWNVAGSVWNGSGKTPAERNEGVSDLGEKVVIKVDDKTVDVNGIALPRGDGETAPIWWNLQKIVIKDVELSAGEHTFKVEPVFNVNVGSFEVYSTSEFEEEKEVSLLSANIVEEDGKAYLVMKGTYAVYTESDFSMDLQVMAGNPWPYVELTSEVTLKDDGTFVVKADLTDVPNNEIDMLAHLNVDDKVIDADFSGSTDGAVDTVILNGVAYTSRFELEKTWGRPMMIFHKDYTIKASREEVGAYTSTKENSKTYVWGSEGVAHEGASSNTGATGPKNTGIKGLDTAGRWLTYTFTISEAGKVDFIWQISGSKWDTVEHNPGIADMSKHIIVTIDGEPVNVAGIELPGGDGEDAPAYWKLYDIVIKNVELSKGQHVFKVDCLGNGGINIATMSIYSDAKFYVYAATKEEVGAYVSEKAYSKTYVWGSEGVANEGASSNTGATGPKNTGIKGLDTAGRWLTYTFKLLEDGKVDFVWQISGSKWDTVEHNPGIADMSKHIIVTIDGEPVNVEGFELPGGDGVDAPAYWKLFDIVIKDVELSKGQHVFRIDCLGNGGINIASMKISSDKVLLALTKYESSREDTTYASEKANSKTYVYGSEGFAHSDGVVEKTAAQTGPEHGTKGFDSAGRWLSYTFTLEEAGKVDFVWEVSGSRWVGSTDQNPGVDDLSKYVIIIIDDKEVDLSGIELPSGDKSISLENLWWNLYDLVISDVELSAGEHTFKAISLGTAGLNIKSMTIASSSAFAE